MDAKEIRRLKLEATKTKQAGKKRTLRFGRRLKVSLK